MVIDVFEFYNYVFKYCVFLGYKVNYFFILNCIYDMFVYFCFGFIKCICILRLVEVDEEFIVVYGYDYSFFGKSGFEVFEWYQVELKVFQVIQ